MLICAPSLPPALPPQAATDALAATHGRPQRAVDPNPLSDGCHGQTHVLDSLVRTMLSQNTTDVTSIRAFRSLKAAFPTWDEVLEAPDAEVEEAIRVGGLAAIKCARIKALLQFLRTERGRCCLEWLREEPTPAIKEFLGQFKGVGPKTMSCVLMFCLGRDEFPVDTHVLHISKALGWVPPSAGREQAYEHLNARVPDDVKYELHVLMVAHGKVCGACSKAGRGDKACPLAALKRGGKGKRGAEEVASPSPPGKKKGKAVAVKVEDVTAAVAVKEEAEETGPAIKEEPGVRIKAE